MLALNNNALETYLLPSPKRSSKKTAATDDAATEPTKTHSVELPGHRNDVRCVAVSSDDNVIASAASGTLKIWNAKSTACIRTMECGYAISMAFLPGDRHVSYLFACSFSFSIPRYICQIPSLPSALCR
jgi:U3 small nucleolar RNA-associated protein 12